MDTRMRAGLRAGALLTVVGALAAPTFAGGFGLCGGNGWGHLPRWIPPGTAAFHDAGRSVDIDGYTAAVGAPGGDAVHLYQRAGSLWAYSQTVTDPNGSGNGFGYALQVDGDTLIVGAPHDATDGAGVGAAHVFRRKGETWHHDEMLHDDTPTEQGAFGTAVSVSGTWSGVGAPEDGNGDTNGTVSVFRHLSGGSVRFAELGWAAGAEFGTALDIEQDADGESVFVFAGAWGHDTEGANSGAVRSYRVSLGGVDSGFTVAPWQLEAGDYFGADLAYDGDTLVVGAYGDDDLGFNAGAVYVFEVDFLNPAPGLTLKQVLTGCLSDELDNFGRSVDIEGERIAVGAPNQESEFDGGGKVHVFQKPWGAPEFSFEDRVVPSDGLLNDDFGWDVAVDADGLLVGARRVDEAGSQGGAAYLVSLASEAYPGGILPTEHLASALSYGEGKPGTFTSPWLVAMDAPVPNEPNLIRVALGLPGALPFLIWGLTPGNIPFDGGTLLVGDPHFVALPPVGPTGITDLTWSPPALAGLDVYMQVMYFDPLAAGALHTSQSKGLHLTIGY